VKAIPAVTVVTPTRKRPALLAETIASVRCQTLQDWEHIIIDDDATGSAHDAAMTAAADDPRVRYLTRTSEIAGANVCRNLGISHARADLIILLDDDDRLRPDCLARRVDVMRRNADLDFAVFKARIFTKEVEDTSVLYHPQDPGDDLLRFLSLECPWQTTGPIWRRNYLQELGAFDESLLSMQDLELHVRALTARARYLCFPYTDHDIRAEIDPMRTSTRHFRDPEYLRRAEAMPARFLAATTAAGLVTWSRRRATFGLAYGVAESWARLGMLGEALRCWRNARRDMNMPLVLGSQGQAMLILTWFNRRQTSYATRLINRWKGAVRFRQEPALTELSAS
jgi:glycosyltransferase involved in cell wall biosynthesis